LSRVPPTLVQVCIDGRWYQGTLRSCEVTSDGDTCTGVVTYHLPHCVQTGRFPATHMRSMSDQPGCPAVHDDRSCGDGGDITPCC